jgi:hypothetical protein
MACGVAAALTLEERILVAAQKAGAAPPKAETPGGLPMAQIGDLKISRMISGGNLISGYAHARDLVYVSRLMREYNTVERVLDTLELCERNGINTLLSDPFERPRTILNRYWKERGGKIQWIVDSRPDPKDVKPKIKMAIDAGASAIYVNGGWAERLVRQGQVDAIAKMVDFIKENGLPAGVGGHLLDVPVACEKEGVDADFYVKTLHSRKYWSSTAEREHDNIWCRKPDETIAFMKSVTKPWIAYKTLAAGAVNPTVGFKYALQGGADILCVGMFDFQVAQDVKIVKGLFKRGIRRERPWRA